MKSNWGRIFGSEDYTGSPIRCQDLVVGSGAGGSVAAARLAEHGRDVILLEEGGYFPKEAFTSNIAEMTARLYRNGGLFPFLGSPTLAFGEGRCVGGGTVINGGLIWRTPPWILEEWQDRYGLNGFSEQELKPHFDTVERDLHVVQHQPEQAENLDSSWLYQAASRLGWKCVMAPRAVRSCSNENRCPTGCPSGAKQTAVETYIPRALRDGARLFSECRATEIVHWDRIARKLIAVTTTKHGIKTFEIAFDRLVLAAGAVQTPHLLRRSGISARAGRDLQFHFNLKVAALFEDEVHAERGTIFTTQVQEFEREGITICASNLQPAYLALTLSHLGNEVIERVLAQYSRAAIYVAMTKPRSRAHIVSALGADSLVWYRFDPADLSDVKKALRRTAQVLFEAGARELYLPVSGTGPVTNSVDLETVLESLKPAHLQLLTVHVMASCPMSPSRARGVVDPEGRLWGMRNVLLTDASILPSNLGESPQGTIMAFAQRLLELSLAG